MKEVRDAIDASQSFMTSAGYNPWTDICSEGQAASVKRYSVLIADFFCIFVLWQ